MKASFADIHHHLTYGLDDGPKKRADMYRMLEAAAKDGIRDVYATVHVTPGVSPFDLEKYRGVVSEARDYCAGHGLELRVHEGCEILYTGHTCRMLREGKLPTLGGSDLALVEFSPDVRYDRLREALRNMASSGFRPVVAHTERYRCLVVWPARVERLKSETGAFFQINCSSVYEKKGWLTDWFVRRTLKRRLIDAVASDAHNTSSRPVKMKRAFRVLKRMCGGQYAAELVRADRILARQED